MPQEKVLAYLKEKPREFYDIMKHMNIPGPECYQLCLRMMKEGLLDRTLSLPYTFGLKGTIQRAGGGDESS